MQGEIKLEPFKQKNESIMELSYGQGNNSKCIAGITTRFGGESTAPFDSLNMGFHVPDDPNRVRNNRKKIATLLEFPLHNWIMGEQTHQTNIYVVNKDDPKIGSGALTNRDALKDIDGLITKQENVLLTAMFADCVPLYYYDPATDWIGIAHAGWRGTVNQMARHMVDKITDHGANISTLQVTIGPSISLSNYQVDEKVFQLIPGKWREEVTQKIDATHYLLDLHKLHQLILIDSGIKPNNIFKTHYCTYQDDPFYSHRKEDGKTGRMLGYIGLKTAR